MKTALAYLTLIALWILGVFTCTFLLTRPLVGLALAAFLGGVYFALMFYDCQRKKAARRKLATLQRYGHSIIGCPTKYNAELLSIGCQCHSWEWRGLVAKDQELQLFLAREHGIPDSVMLRLFKKHWLPLKAAGMRANSRFGK